VEAVVAEQRVVSAVLPNGVRIGVETVGGGGSQDIARGQVLDLGELGSALEGMAILVKDALIKVAPDSAKVEFGMNVKVESGKLTALLVGGSATASLKITLGWGRNSPHKDSSEGREDSEDQDDSADRDDSTDEDDPGGGD
jgi:hypothetical protein